MRFVNYTISLAANALRRFGFDFKENADPRIVAMKREISGLGGKIEFAIEQHPDGSWAAESKNIDGIITGGANFDDKGAMIRDAIFTYFGIPPHLCNNTLLKSDNEAVTVTQRMYV